MSDRYDYDQMDKAIMAELMCEACRELKEDCVCDPELKRDKQEAEWRERFGRNGEHA